MERIPAPKQNAVSRRTAVEKLERKNKVTLSQYLIYSTFRINISSYLSDKQILNTTDGDAVVYV
jgi:hypothetical protein